MPWEGAEEKKQKQGTNNAHLVYVRHVHEPEYAWMKTLLAYSLQLVREGHTTFEEVERVTFTDSGLEAELKAKRKQGLTCKGCHAELKPEWLDCPYCMTPRFTD
jgi:hypothetical protein